jgi:hypothetical protein
MSGGKEPVSLPSMRGILWTDYGAFISAVLLIMIWVVYLAWVPSWRADGPIVSPFLAPYYLVLCLLVSVVCLGILGYRVLLLRRVFRLGEQVRGRITSIEMQRDRGRVEYVFRLKGEERRARAFIHRTKQTLAIKNGDRVILLVDPSRPERAFIRDLYS